MKRPSKDTAKTVTEEEEAMQKCDVSIGDHDDKKEKPEEKLPGQTSAAINVISAPGTTMDVKEVDVVWTSADD